MGRNREKDAMEMAAKKQRILENGFRIFSEQTIEKVKMTDVAEASGIGIASLYRYYSTKQALVMGVGTWVWDQYTKSNIRKLDDAKPSNATAADEFNYFLESFLEMYAHHKDILRFNQFFNIYLQSENISEEDKKPYTDVILALVKRFSDTYRKGRQDGTLRTDLPEEKVFSVCVHLMLAAVTRYAVGLAYGDATDAEEELRMLKSMLQKRFIRVAPAAD